MKEKYQKFLTTDFIVFDLETSGLDPLNDEILEIAAIKLNGKDTKDKFEALLQPTRAIPPDTEKIHGLNEVFLLVNGRPAKAVMKEFMDFVGDAIVVGHNIREFDWLFILNHQKKTTGELPQNKMIDTLELSRKMLRLPRYNLGEVASHFGHSIENAHRAMSDTEASAKVFIDLMEMLLNKKD